MYRGSDSKYRRGTRFKVVFPTLPTIKTPPTKVYLYQKQNNHDLLTMEFPVVSSLWFNNLKTGTPVVFSWKQGVHNNTWYGYVSFTTKEVVAQKRQIMKIQCVGGSYLLKQRSTRVFTNATVTECIEIIAKEFGIKPITVPTMRRFQQLTIAGHSYWEWIQEQANKLGYAAYMEGLTLHFKPFDKVIDIKAKNVPILSMHTKAVKFASQHLDRTLDYIEVMHGQHVESASYSRSINHIGGIDPFTGEVLNITQSPNEVTDNLRSEVYSALFHEYRSDIVIDNPTAGKEAIEGTTHMARFTTPAKVKCQGDPRIHPYAPVIVEYTGPITDGYWIVKEAIHMFGRSGEYQMEMTIMTDGIKTNNDSITRPRSPSRIGTVNVEDMIENNSNFKAGDEVTIVSTENFYDFSKQGLSSSGYRWVNKRS